MYFCIKMMFSFFLLCLVDFTLGSTEEADIGLTICDGSEWVKFKDEKCYKLIKKWATRSDAQELCSKEMLEIDSSVPQLATIKTPEEQDYLTNYVFNSSEVMINVWIGAQRKQDSNQFVWDDGSDVEFANWIEEGPSDRPERGCVEMQYQFARKVSDSEASMLGNGGNGKWRDATCGLPNYVVCEKLQRWSFVPIGFIYVQLPNQPEPKSIWPMVEWTQITSSYAGLFFRAEGGGSSAFGSNQADNAPRLTGIQFQAGVTYTTSIKVNAGATSDWIKNGGTNRQDGFKFTLSGGEVRPRNTAMRIWKRTK